MGAAINVLALEDVQVVVINFELLNPYDRQFVKDRLLKMEDVNAHDGIQQQLSGLAIAAKRYALFRRTMVGDIHIPKASVHGLGFLYHPRRTLIAMYRPGCVKLGIGSCGAPSICLERNQPGFSSRP
jgi:hypothetical protein